MEKTEIKIVKPFGPSVVVTKIPVNTLEMLNKYIDDIVADKKKSADLDHGHKLVGDVTQEFLLEKEIIEKSGWGKFLTGCVSKWMELEMKAKMTKFELLNSWIVRQFENEYNPTHWHGGHISGAGFLKVPSTFGKHTQDKNKNYKGGQLQLINGTRHFVSPSTITEYGIVCTALYGRTFDEKSYSVGFPGCGVAQVSGLARMRIFGSNSFANEQAALLFTNG